MMLESIVHGTSSLLRRSVEDGDPTPSLPGWTWPVFGLELILFFPVLLFVTYTLGALYPALAIVEDDTVPPTYQPLSLDADDPEEGGQARTGPAEDGFPITASLRRVHALVKSLSGWQSLFRGIIPLFAARFATNTLRLIIGAPLKAVYLAPLASIPAYLALVQLHTVWVHVVITPPNPLPFWRRLPPFKKTFQATALPFVLYAVAGELAGGVPMLMFMRLGPMSNGDFVLVDFLPRALLTVVLWFVLWFFLALPAHIALMRIQASLLPPDEDPIVPFDRSFGGRVNSLLSVGGVSEQGEKTHATLRDIWETLSRAAIWRVALMVLKATAICLGVSFMLGAVFFCTLGLAGVPMN